MYMDLLVEVTNMWNECDFDYYMQAFAPVGTSLSGFLWFFVACLSMVVNASEEYVYMGMS